MPKFIGCSAPARARRIENNATPAALVRLSYSQMVLIPARSVRFSLDTTDQGGPRVLAKRWYRWFTTPEAILRSKRATLKMIAAARATLALVAV